MRAKAVGTTRAELAPSWWGCCGLTPDGELPLERDLTGGTFQGSALRAIRLRCGLDIHFGPDGTAVHATVPFG
jgi:hypothetical protein